MFIIKGINVETELVITEVWSNTWKITVVIHIYITQIGDFNAHNELLAEKKRGRNGRIFGNFIDKKNLIVLNDV